MRVQALAACYKPMLPSRGHRFVRAVLCGRAVARIQNTSRKRGGVVHVACIVTQLYRVTAGAWAAGCEADVQGCSLGLGAGLAPGCGGAVGLGPQPVGPLGHVAISGMRYGSSPFSAWHFTRHTSGLPQDMSLSIGRAFASAGAASRAPPPTPECPQQMRGAGRVRLNMCRIYCCLQQLRSAHMDTTPDIRILTPGFVPLCAERKCYKHRYNWHLSSRTRPTPRPKSANASPQD